MQSAKNSKNRLQDNRLAEFPALATLRLAAPDLEELADQGFVCEERRGDRTYFKLRFRRNGKQVVRYIGSEDRAEMVKNELSILQSQSKIMRDLRERAKMASKMLREAKRTLEPLLEANGFVFHGLAIRRPRQQKNVTITNSSS